MTTGVERNSRLGKIDMTDAYTRPLLERFDLSYYPTFKIFRRGVEVPGSHLPHFRDAAKFVKQMIAERSKEVSISLSV